MLKKCETCNKKTLKNAGGLTFSNRGYDKESSLYECVNCGFAKVLPKPSEKRISRIYSQDYHYRKTGLMDKLLQFLLDQKLTEDANQILKYTSSGRILDIGAGRGDLLTKFDDEFEKWAYDPFLSEKEEGALKGKIGMHVNDFKKLEDYPKSKFDTVIIRNIIEHTNEYRSLLGNINKLLKKNGLLFIRTPNTDSVDYKLLKNRWWVLNMDGHIVFFSKGSIKMVLDKHGFETDNIKTEKGSSLLSLYRSSRGKNKVKDLISSIIYSAVSPALGEGGDMMVLAHKK